MALSPSHRKLVFVALTIAGVGLTLGWLHVGGTGFVNTVPAWVSQHGFSAAPGAFGYGGSGTGSSGRWRSHLTGACQHWDPLAPERDDPPDCLRARQFRQIQAFKRDPVYEYPPEVDLGLKKLEKCMLGLIACPENPVIVSDWWYMIDGMRGWASGEAIWLGGVAGAVQDEGFIILPTTSKIRARHLLRVLSESIHMFWAQDIYAFQCISDPTCIRPEDYTPALTPEFRRKQPAPGEMGVTPMWKIFATTYWGARPTTEGDMVNDRNLGDPDHPDWSYNPLGKHFVITPYPYPDHAWLPMTMERESLSIPVVPWEEKNNTVLILGKYASYFFDFWSEALFPHWPEVIKWLDGQGYEFLCVAENGTRAEHRVPQGMRNIGQQNRDDYVKILSQSKVLLGIGRPEVSPSPFVALGAGASIVMPYMGDTPLPEGYALYNQFLAQHGPINAIREPYTYTYDVEDYTTLITALDKAIHTPIKAYIPPDYSERRLRERTREFLYHNYEGDYKRAKAANGGLPPALSEVMLQRCFQDGHCNHEPVPDK